MPRRGADAVLEKSEKADRVEHDQRDVEPLARAEVITDRGHERGVDRADSQHEIRGPERAEDLRVRLHAIDLLLGRADLARHLPVERHEEADEGVDPEPRRRLPRPLPGRKGKDQQRQQRHDQHVRGRVEQEVALQKTAREELAQHEQRKPERDRPRRQRLRPAQRAEDQLRRDGKPACDLQMAQRNQPALQHALRVVTRVFFKVLVLVEYADVKEEADQHEHAQERPAVVVHDRRVRLGQGDGEELVGRVVGEDQQDVRDGREPLVQVLQKATDER